MHPTDVWFTGIRFVAVSVIAVYPFRYIDWLHWTRAGSLGYCSHSHRWNDVWCDG